MINETHKPNKKYDLLDRTRKFGTNCIALAKLLEKNAINNSLIDQFIRSSTSVGANYMEADCASSKKDFKHKIIICKKESKETTHWIAMIQSANEKYSNICENLYQEAHELTLIFSSIAKNTL